MIRDRLKELEIRITELADYLQISRTTLYKFIELYDSGQQKDVNPSVRKLFDFIENNELIGKKNVIGYILENMTACRTLQVVISAQQANPEIHMHDGLSDCHRSATPSGHPDPLQAFHKNPLANRHS